MTEADIAIREEVRGRFKAILGLPEAETHLSHALTLIDEGVPPSIAAGILRELPRPGAFPWETADAR